STPRALAAQAAHRCCCHSWKAANTSPSAPQWGRKKVPPSGIDPVRGMSAPPYTTALGLSASITHARIWEEELELVRLPLPLLTVGWGRSVDRNIWRDFRVFRIQRQPLLKPRLGVGLDRVDRALRLAHPAINAFVRVDDEHVLALVEAVHRAHFDAVHGFAANATLVDDIGQLTVLSARRSGELVEAAAGFSTEVHGPGKCRSTDARLDGARLGRRLGWRWPTGSCRY